MAAKQADAKVSENIQNLIRALLDSLDRRSDSFAWATQLAGALNQTMPCPSCNGRGWRERHVQCHHDTQDRYVLDCYGRVECKACHGCTRVLPEQRAATLPLQE